MIKYCGENHRILCEQVNHTDDCSDVLGLELGDRDRP
jgi:hypothetical protein